MTPARPTPLSKFLLNLLGKNATAQRKRMIGFACVIIMNVIFNYVGVDPFASLFTMIGIATGVMAEADIPRKYMPVMLVLGSTLGNVMPGSLGRPQYHGRQYLDPEYTGLVSSMSGWWAASPSSSSCSSPLSSTSTR